MLSPTPTPPPALPPSPSRPPLLPPSPLWPADCPGECPLTMVWPGGLDTGCTCSPGYELDSKSSCRRCPVGTWKASYSNASCIPCNDLSNTSGTGSTSPDACICVAFYTGESGNCEFDAQYLALLIGIPLCVLSIFCCFCVCCCFRFRGHSEAVQARKREEAAKRQRVRDSVGGLLVLNFPYCVMSVSSLRQAGCMMQHEEALARSKIRSLSTWEDAVSFATSTPIVFVSHQWLGYSNPDPLGVQYHEMLRALSMLCEDVGATEDELHVWLDYHSIPQLNANIKRAAISSIAVYAACARYFIVVAPKALHVDSAAQVGPESYAARGWCRLEQWANLAMGGLANAFLLDSNGLRKLADEPGWVRSSVQVFDGAFTVQNDKEVLVDVLLGLYGFSLLDTTGRSDELIGLVQELRSTVFPSKHFHDLLDLLETEVELWNAAREAAEVVPAKNELAEKAVRGVCGCLGNCAGCCCYVCCGPSCYGMVCQRHRHKNRKRKARKMTSKMKAELERIRGLAESILKARSKYSDIKQFDREDGATVLTLLGGEVKPRVSEVSSSLSLPVRHSHNIPDQLHKIVDGVRQHLPTDPEAQPPAPAPA